MTAVDQRSDVRRVDERKHLADPLQIVVQVVTMWNFQDQPNTPIGRELAETVDDGRRRLDPLAPLELETETYGWMTDELLCVAKSHGSGRLISILEGGYHLDALADSVSLHVSRLLDA